MHLVIFFGEAPLHIYSKENASFLPVTNSLFEDPDVDSIVQLINQLKNNELNNCIVVATDFERIKHVVLSQFSIIEAAGGIIENEKNELLFIFRRGKWDLPKGKIEPGESPEIAAKREINEETGITGIVLTEKITETYHYYASWGKEVMKISHWFHGSCSSKSVITPQYEEDIEAVKWFHKNDLEIPFSNTYSNIKLLFNSFIHKKD